MKILSLCPEEVGVYSGVMETNLENAVGWGMFMDLWKHTCHESGQEG